MAYGARLESGLGASPQGFKSPILRAHQNDSALAGSFCILRREHDLGGENLFSGGKINFGRFPYPPPSKNAHCRIDRVDKLNQFKSRVGVNHASRICRALCK